MARKTIWLAAGSILAAFNIEKAVGTDGKYVEPSIGYTTSSLLR